MVVGGCGDYFDVADTVVMMEDYIPRDATLQAKAVAEEIPSSLPDDESTLFRKVAPALCCYAVHYFVLLHETCAAPLECWHYASARQFGNPFPHLPLEWVPVSAYGVSVSIGCVATGIPTLSAAGRAECFPRRQRKDTCPRQVDHPVWRRRG